MRGQYLSFAGDEGFRGACMVHGANIDEAILRASELGINPGGEVVSCPIDDLELFVPEKWRDRLLTKQDVADFDREMGSPDGPHGREVVAHGVHMGHLDIRRES